LSLNPLPVSPNRCAGEEEHGNLICAQPGCLNSISENRKTTNPIETHIVPIIASPIRLQEYGVGIFIAALTKSALKKALKKELITVDGVVATSATFINGGETIKMSTPQDVNLNRKLVFPLKVLFEDEHLAVIHKPAGILVSGNKFKTVANALVQNVQRSNLPDFARPQPVHRLDYATTGALLVGKTSSSIRALNKMFENKEIQKTYYAVAIGEMNDQGTIDSTVDGKASSSNYKLLKSVASKRFARLNLVELKPQTGRRHQLRKHLSGIGNPILGDKDYGVEGLILNGKGLYLHAYSLTFTHPFTNKTVLFEDELPERFKKIFFS
jgi:23S rRNA pseudouridine1911/1915/1917 synthase